jgi:hypothetical protein
MTEESKQKLRDAGRQDLIDTYELMPIRVCGRKSERYNR